MYKLATLYHKSRLVLAAWLLVAGPLAGQSPGTVNSRPTLHAITDQLISAAGGSRFVELSGIGAGDESGQTTSVDVSSSNIKLFEHLQVIPTSNGQAVLQYAVKKGVTGTATVTVTVRDNGTPAAITSRSFSIAVVPRGTAIPNTQPTLDPIKDYETRSTEDGRFIELTGITAGLEGNQSTAMSVNSSNNALFHALSVQPTSNGQAIVQLFPKKGASGQATLTVTVSDNGKPAATVSKSFVVSLKPSGGIRRKKENTVPTLDAISDRTVRSGSDGHFIELTGITAGKETGQSTNIVVNSSNTRLLEAISVNAGANGTGYLQYGIKKGASGVTRITVTVADDGKPAASVTKTFTLTVQKPAKRAKKMPEVINTTSGMVLSGFPNPFYKQASISFSTATAERRVNLDVYDAAGVRVQQLFNGSTEAGRMYNVPVNGASLAAGIYIVRMTTAKKKEMLKMVLVK